MAYVNQEVNVAPVGLQGVESAVTIPICKQKEQIDDTEIPDLPAHLTEDDNQRGKNPVKTKKLA